MEKGNPSRTAEFAAAVSGLDTWINEAGGDGWELVSSTPLIAPNKDGVAYGTIGVHLIFKRPHTSVPEG